MTKQMQLNLFDFEHIEKTKEKEMPSRNEINERIVNEKKKSMTKRMRYIVPFSFCNEGYCVESLCDKVDFEGNHWVQTSVKSGDQDLYKFVLDSFADYGSRMDNTYVASSFVYQTKDGSPVKCLRYYEEYSENRKRKFNYIADFDIRELGLFLFGTGTGFLWYEISDFYHGKEDAEQGEKPVDYEMPLNKLYEFQFKFKELNRYRFAELFRCKKGEEEELFLMGNWIAGLLAALNLKVSFFAERENERIFNDRPNECLWVPDKAVLFSYAAFNEGKVGVGFDFSTPTYYLTKGYKLSYTTPENVREQMRYPFRNVCFYAAQEGAGYCAVYNEKNYSNFLGNMYDKVMNDYFLMYILLLHQKYTIVKFRDEIGANLSAVAAEYSERVIRSSEAEKAFLANEELLDEMVTKLTVFVTKNIHTSVSHIHHQNDFYSYVSEQLEIQKECTNLSQGLQVLQDNLRSKRTKYEADKEGKRDRQISSMLAMISVVAFVSTLFSIEDFVHDFLLEKAEGSEKVLLLSHPAYIAVLCGFGALFLYVIGVLIINGLRQRKLRMPWQVIREAWVAGKAEEAEETKRKELQVDRMTGLYNMRAYAELEDYFLKKAAKRKRCLLVGMVDINGLDAINREKSRSSGEAMVYRAADGLKSIAEQYPEMKIFRKEEDRFLLLDVVSEAEAGRRQEALKKEMLTWKVTGTDGIDRQMVCYGFSLLRKEQVDKKNCMKQVQEEAYFALKKEKKAQERAYAEQKKQE